MHGFTRVRFDDLWCGTIKDTRMINNESGKLLRKRITTKQLAETFHDYNLRHHSVNNKYNNSDFRDVDPSLIIDERDNNNKWNENKNILDHNPRFTQVPIYVIFSRIYNLPKPDWTSALCKPTEMAES